MAVFTSIGFGAERGVGRYLARGRESLNNARIGWDNLVRDASITSTGSEQGFPAAAAATYQTYEGWKPSESGDSISVNLLGQKYIDYIAIGAHTLSKCASITIERRTGGLEPWQEIPIKPASGPSTILNFSGQTDHRIVNIAEDDSAIMILLPKTIVQSFRITVTYYFDTPFIGNISAGNVLEMFRPIYAGHSPEFLATSAKKSVSESESGEFLGQSIIRKGRSPSYSWENIPIDWYAQNFDPFARRAQDTPFYIAWRPGAFPADCFYGYASKISTPSNSGTLNFVSMGMDVTAHCPAKDPAMRPLTKTSLGSLISFSRGSSAPGYLYVYSADYSSGTPRYVVDRPGGPFTAFAILVEQYSKNYLLHSDSGFSNSVWGQSNGLAEQSDKAVWLDGSHYWDVSNTSDSRVSGGIKQSCTLDSNGRHTAWAYARPGSTSYLYAVFTAGTDVARVIFDLDSGEIVDEQDATSSGFSARTWETPDRGYQCIIELNDTQGTSSSILFAPTNNPTISAAPIDETGASVKLLAAQAENGVDTQLIKTTTSPASRDGETLTLDAIAGFDPGIGTVKVTAWAHPGETIFRLGSVEVVADDSYQIKTYTASYTDDPGATEIEILPGSNGWVERVEYIPWLE